MRVVVEVYSHVVWAEVLLNFGLGEEVNAVEQDRVVADLERRAHIEHHLTSLDVVSVLFEGEVVEELEQSASEDAVLLLVSSSHALLDGLAEGLPLGAAVGESVLVLAGRDGFDEAPLLHAMPFISQL